MLLAAFYELESVGLGAVHRFGITFNPDTFGYPLNISYLLVTELPVIASTPRIDLLLDVNDFDLLIVILLLLSLFVFLVIVLTHDLVSL